MNKRRILIALLIFIAIVTLSAKIKIVFACEDNENFPFYTDNGTAINWEKPGISVELVKLLESELEIEIEIVRFPWNRCLDTMGKGKIDGTFQASFKKKRMKMGVYPMVGDKPDISKRLCTVSYNLYKIKGSNLDWDGKKFINISGEIGAPFGYSIIDDIKKLGVGVDTSKNTETDFKKMQKNRIQGVAALKLSADFLIKSNSNFHNIERIDKPIKTKPYYLMLSHQFVDKNPELANKIWDTIEKLRETKFEEISEKYFK